MQKEYEIVEEGYKNPKQKNPYLKGTWAYIAFDKGVNRRLRELDNDDDYC